MGKSRSASPQSGTIEPRQTANDRAGASPERVWFDHWREQPEVLRERSRDWRDCAHCRHYHSGFGGGGGTPPWAFCQLQPMRSPTTCSEYAYTHRPYLNDDASMRGLS